MYDLNSHSSKSIESLINIGSMDTIEKNCPNCKHLQKEQDKTLLERDGKKVAVKIFPKVCLKGNHKIMREWFLTKPSCKLDCFED